MSDKYPNPPGCQLADVEWRADSEPYQRGSGTVARWVPHLTYSICANLLDEWVGSNNWRIDGYKLAPWNEGGLMCQVSIRFPGSDEWVPRQAAGDIPVGQHSVKGAETDAFKRCVGRAWGCGRNVYELPTLFAPCGSRQAKSGKTFATMIPETVPALVKELKKLGFNPGEHVIVAADEHGHDVSDESPASGADEGPKPATAQSQGEPSPAPPSDYAGGDIKAMLGQLHSQKEVIRQLREQGLWPLSSIVEGSEQHASAELVIRSALSAEDEAAK